MSSEATAIIGGKVVFSSIIVDFPTLKYIGGIPTKNDTDLDISFVWLEIPPKIGVGIPLKLYFLFSINIALKLIEIYKYIHYKYNLCK